MWNVELPISAYKSKPWGPIVSEETFDNYLKSIDIYPLECSSKQERLGRICDFTYLNTQKIHRDNRPTLNSPEDEADFQLVDSRPLKINRYQHKFNRKPQQTRRGSLAQQQQVNYQYNGLQGRTNLTNNVQSQKLYQQQQNQRQQQWQRTNRLRQLAEWSIEPQHDWQLIETWQLPSLNRLILDSSKIKFQDIDWRGKLCVYDKTADRIIPKNRVMLNDKFTQLYTFYWPSTTDDDIIMKTFNQDPNITVAATDQILACLMAASQSRLSWHLIFDKNKNKILIDKQNGSSIDLYTVDETSKDPPLSDNINKINRPADLGAEALKINQNFSQQMLNLKVKPVEVYNDPTFVDPKDSPANWLYRYRIVTLPPMMSPNTSDSSDLCRQPINIVLRSEINAVLPDKSNEYILIRALNEACLSRTGQSWTRQLESHHGALIAQESKNNHCKVGKWVSQAVISDCQTIKIGFISRLNTDNNQRHSILSVHTYKVQELGIQIGMQKGNIWGIVRTIIDTILSQEDGRYILVKDPVKSEMKLYRVLLSNPEGISDVESLGNNLKIVDNLSNVEEKSPVMP